VFVIGLLAVDAAHKNKQLNYYYYYYYYLRVQVLTAGSMKMTAFWDIASCILIEVDRRFRGFYCVCHQGDEVRTFETSVCFNETTQPYTGKM
jgi:hypothetical protein